MGEDDGEREARSSSGDTPYLAPEDRKLLDLGKAEHRDTTATARRALQVAEKTGDVARSTLVEMHRQGRQLERAELGVQQVGQEVREASAVLRFMRRWCCFQCCCDPTADLDRTRRRRVAAARSGQAFQEENIQRRYEAKAQAVDRIARRHDPAHGSDEQAARQELFADAERIRAARRSTTATAIGFGLPEADRQELQRETEQQDVLIDRIGDAVQSLHAMSKEMHGEMAEQEPRLEALHDRAAAAHDQLGSLAREARRI